MANTKISALTALASAASDDVIAIVDTDAGATKKITIANLFIVPGGVQPLLPDGLIIGVSASQDRIIIQGVAKGAGQFDGTLSLIDLTAARAWNLPNLDGTIGLLTNKLSDFASTTSTELLGVISDETGSGALVFGTSPTFTTQIISPIVYGSAAASGTLTLKSTSHGTLGNVSIGRLTLSDLANADGMVFGDLGTATRGIDMSASGLSGVDYLLYSSAGNYWRADGGLMVYSDTIQTNYGLFGGYVRCGEFKSLTDTPLGIQAFGYGNIILNADSDSTILFGQYNPVGSLTACSSNGTTTITKATHGLTLAAGELVHVTASSTAGDLGFYRYVSGDANTIVVDRALGTSTGIALTAYKDVISMHATDATNGQMLTSWSAQNKPMQLGGTVLVATTNLTSKDLYIGGNIGFSGQTANGTVATTITSLGPTGAATTIQGWIKIIDSGGTARYIPYF